jgi:hypothetical protein
MKKVSLISSFCDTQEKIDILEKNIKIIKSHNIDVIVISPFYLTKNIIELCDYFFVTKDNPVFEWPERAMFYWRIFSSDIKKYKLTTTYPDYGYAGLSQVKQLSEIALNLDYEQFYHMIYDLKIDDNVIDGFYSDKTCSVYPSKREEIIWTVGLHYMIFNKENLKNFTSYITKENYLSTKDLDAFAWLHSHQKNINYVIEPIPVEDEIYYYQNHDFLNYSPVENLKFFIDKNYEIDTNIKLFFYGNEELKNIKLTVGNVESIHTVNDYYIIDLGFDKFNIQEVKLEYGSITYDLTKIIHKIKHNGLYEI